MEKLTAEQAFKAMIFFLENYYERKYLDFLGGILGEFLILEDGGTADPSAGTQWIECLEKVVKKQPITKKRKKFITIKSITIDEAYETMYLLIKLFSDQMLQPEDLVILLNDLDKYREEGINSYIGKEWLAAVDVAIADKYALDVNKFFSKDAFPNTITKEKVAILMCTSSTIGLLHDYLANIIKEENIDVSNKILDFLDLIDHHVYDRGVVGGELDEHLPAKEDRIILKILVQKVIDKVKEENVIDKLKKEGDLDERVIDRIIGDFEGFRDKII